ncbi:MAG: hypothetical protein EBZ74_08780 [Planctomycetia bacterium]|nr:hypothetical protein [Planctomycetia bacterium]
MFAARDPDDIDRFFRGLTEYAFHARLGVVDPPLVDYVALLLVRFLRHDPSAAPAPGAPGTPDVTTLFAAARDHSPDEALAEYRHIGDYTLFWSGLYPEAVERLRRLGRADHLVDFRAAGKQAYWIASTLEPADAGAERLLFERLSHDYDLCVEGLGEVRRAWNDAA